MSRAVFVLAGMLAASLGLPSLAHANDQRLSRVLVEAIQPCWNPPPSSSPAKIVIALRKDGSLAGQPRIVNPSPDEQKKAFEQSTVRALLRCAPFTKAAQFLTDRKTEIVVNFTLDGMSLSEAVEPALSGLSGVDVRLSSPEGLCRVDGERSDAEAQYNEFTAGVVEQNLPIVVFLECGLIEAIRVDVDNFELPNRWATLLTPTRPDGTPIRLPEQSLASVIDYYEDLFRQLGAKESPFNQAMDEAEARASQSTGVTLEDRLQRHVDTDERAVYILTYTVAREGETMIPVMAIGAFSQIFDYPVTLNLYARFDPEKADELLAEAKRVMASLHESSTRSE